MTTARICRKILTSTQQKYSAYDRKLLAIYTAVKRFQHAVQGRYFKTYTDHKLLIYAFLQELEKSSQRQFCYLDYVAQFTTFGLVRGVGDTRTEKRLGRQKRGT